MGPNKQIKTNLVNFRVESPLFLCLYLQEERNHMKYYLSHFSIFKSELRLSAVHKDLFPHYFGFVSFIGEASSVPTGTTGGNPKLPFSDHLCSLART